MSLDIDDMKGKLEKIGKGDIVDKAKQSLSLKDALRKNAGFLKGINKTINSAVAQLNDAAKNIGAVFQKNGINSDINALLQEQLKSVQWSTENPVIYGGFGLTINNKPLGVERLEYITSISIQQNVGTSSSLEFTVIDPEFYFIEDKVFLRETPIQASITILGDESKKCYFDGYIAAIDIEFPSDGAPTLQVHCIDKTHEMTRVKYRRSWENVNSAQVVKAIADEMGYQCYVEEGYNFPIQASIIQDNMTNIEFLEDLASKELDMFVCTLVTNEDGKTIIYYVIKGHINEDSYISVAYRKQSAEPLYGPQLEPSKIENFDVVSFRPQINIETREEKTQDSGVNADTKAIESASSVPDSYDATESSEGSSSSGSESSDSSSSSSSGEDSEEDVYIPI